MSYGFAIPNVALIVPNFVACAARVTTIVVALRVRRHDVASADA